MAGAAGVNATFQGGDTFTANELVIVNLTGAAPVLYTLDGTAASAGGNTGAFAGTNGAALSTLSNPHERKRPTTALWGTSGIGTIVTSGGTHTFAWTGQSGSTLTGCTYSAPTTDTVGYQHRHIPRSQGQRSGLRPEHIGAAHHPVATRPRLLR